MNWWDTPSDYVSVGQDDSSLFAYRPPTFDFGGGYDYGAPGFQLGDIGGAFTYTPPQFDFGGGVDYAAPDLSAPMPGFQYQPPAFDFGGGIDYGLPGFQSPALPEMMAPGAGVRLPDAASPIPRGNPIVEGIKSAGGKVAGALDKATDNPGKLAQGLAGIGSLAAVGAGLAKGSGPSKLQMSPETKAAYDALAAERARASGSMASRGYAGEEGIRQKLNEQIMAALNGEGAQVSPEIARRKEEDLRVLKDRLRAELGPGFETSTAGQNAIANRERMWEEVIEQAAEQRLATRHGMGMQRSGFRAGLEDDAAQFAGMELGFLGGMDARQQAQDGADRRQLFQLGGQLGGLALSPWLQRALLDQYRAAGVDPRYAGGYTRAAVK